MIKFRLFAGIIASAIVLSACEEDTYGIGNSLTGQTDKLDIAAQTYKATTRTIVADSVLAVSNICYFGKIKDPETGTYVKSELTSQFNILETIYVSPEDSLISRYDGRAAADSCDIILFTSTPFVAKDSLITMKMRVKELSAPITVQTALYSNYDPIAKGLIRNDGINKGKVFSYNDLNESDSLKSLSTYLHNIRITLNDPYTDLSGNTYNNYGSYILRQYFDHPEYFKNSYAFTHHVCPGFFFELTDGLGYHAQVDNIGMRVYYRVKNDTTYNAVLTLAGTEEVLQTNKITNTKEALQQMAADPACTYLKSPAGLYTEMTLPVEEIKVNHENDSLVAAKVILQRINNNVNNEYSLGIPQNLLMVEKDSVNAFFENNKLTDGITSFYVSYNSTENTYTFSNISNIITHMWNARQKGLQADAQWLEKNPNWNKVVLVPVSVSTSTSTGIVTSISNDMSLTSTRLAGGSATPVNISVVYAKFKEQ